MQIGRFAGVESFVSQAGQFKYYSEFNKKPMQLMHMVGLMSMFVVGHATLYELRRFGCVAPF